MVNKESYLSYNIYLWPRQNKAYSKPAGLSSQVSCTDIYYKIDRILRSPFSCPVIVIVMPRHRKGSCPRQFLPCLAIAGARTNTEVREQLLKNIQQPRQADGPGQFPIYSNIKICGVLLNCCKLDQDFNGR